MSRPATSPSESEKSGSPAPTLFRAGRALLNPIERLNVLLVGLSIRSRFISHFLAVCQRTVGQSWIHFATKNLLRIVGLERAGSFDATGSVLVVSNHRSFFDLYVITAALVRSGLKKRILFPVRSDFFYTSPLGFAVNFCMSFLAMYPPLFRSRRQAALNLNSLTELASLLDTGNFFVGVHPEGTRKKDDDPYTFLPAQPGVGRIIHECGVRVVPVFINGLGNDLVAQVRGNWSRRGAPILVVVGAPIDFGTLRDERGSPRVYRALAERCMEEIARLGQEERELRSELLDTERIGPK